MESSVSSLVSFQSQASLQKGGWVVQKFGGTSVGKFSTKIADDIVKVYSKQNKVAVVCSARSSNTKSEGTTSRLLASADRATDGTDFEEILLKVLEDHIENAKALIQDSELRDQLISDTEFEVDEVRKLLNASQVIGEISPRTLDTIMACGEKLSCRFMSALLNDRGISSQYVDLSNIIPVGFDTSNGFDATFYKFLSDSFAHELSSLDAGTVPVLTGYFGIVPGGLLNGVGRGYTDLCAALVAVGLQADELQVWKEVDGIFTADPRKVKTARLLQSVTPDEAAELTYYGSEVIHPFTMEQVIKAKIPIRIKNVENPTGQGTIIYPEYVGKKGEETPPHPPTSIEKLPTAIFTRPKSATAVTTKHDIVVINMHSNKKTLSHGFLATIFGILDKHKLVVDLISTSEVHVSMALHNTNESRKELKKAVEELGKFGVIDVTHDLAIVSLVGVHMKQLIGIAGNMFKTLADEKINIEMISQGANEINISCVINEKDSLRALQAIHDKILDAPLNNGAIDQRIAELRLNT
ncbi:unnamed protein product [Kuraishia capsulata CBS 1993]|uniref:Aspartokinase n=1 Tax=Kuraishia capsulata CBS 1993 TaxID=1382522 RepID=W6MK10_9ASCO|nr:uncharacterized protein KUCA_T00002299001 [Kuraishia capsulata CBS 1993]CDK26328.1 unnamed protein product [Kuraishia capsulata CBS 1993]